MSDEPNINYKILPLGSFATTEVIRQTKMNIAAKKENRNLLDYVIKF